MNHLSIAVVTLNDKIKLIKCLNSILNNSYPKDKYEILVIDGGSKDGTIEYLR